MRTGGAFEAEALPPHQHPPPAAAVGWKSPVPYLFGGLAAMLGLIAFALLILACSYWKLSGNLDAGADDSSGAGEGKPSDGGEKEKAETMFSHSVPVIMAGDKMAKFLATPAPIRAPSFQEGGRASSSGGGEGEVTGQKEVVLEMARSSEERENGEEREGGAAVVSGGDGGGHDEEEKR